MPLVPRCYASFPKRGVRRNRTLSPRPCTNLLSRPPVDVLASVADGPLALKFKKVNGSPGMDVIKVSVKHVAHAATSGPAWMR